MLHQPAAQLLIRSDALHKLVLAQAGSNAENIIQTVNALGVQSPPEDVLFLCAHAVDLLRKLVEFFQFGTAGQVDVLNVLAQV